MMNNKMIFYIIVGLTMVLFYLQSSLGKTFDRVGNKEIRLFQQKVKYVEAKKLCRDWGNEWLSENTGRLVSITNHEEQTRVNKLISTSQTLMSLLLFGETTSASEPGYFSGANYEASRNTWVWQNGQEIQYTNWVEPEQDSNANEKCFQFLMKNSSGSDGQYSVGQWLKVSCESRKFYICEREIHPLLRWGYENNGHADAPDQWHQTHGSCSGDRQSPVNIPFTSLATCSAKSDGRLVRGWKLRGNNAKWKVENTGRFVKITPSPPMSMYTTFFGSTERHYVNYMLLKWGNTIATGSEHSIDGRHTEGELQVFHYPIDGNPSNEIHALSYLLEERPVILNTHWNNLVEAIRRIQYVNESYEIAAPREGVRELLKDGVTDEQVVDHLNYVQDIAFRYRGSLPHPPCFENVIWTIFPRPIPLQTTQFLFLRRLQMEGDLKMSNNFRPLQQNDSPICTLRS